MTPPPTLRFTQRSLEEIATSISRPTTADLLETGAEAVTDYARQVSRALLAEGYTAKEVNAANNRIFSAYSGAVQVAKSITTPNTTATAADLAAAMPTL